MIDSSRQGPVMQPVMPHYGGLFAEFVVHIDGPLRRLSRVDRDVERSVRRNAGFLQLQLLQRRIELGLRTCQLLAEIFRKRSAGFAGVALL